MEDLNLKLESLRNAEEVKVGDKVIIALRKYGTEYYEISTVQKVTKTQITVKGIVFKNGIQKGSSWFGWEVFKYNEDAAQKISDYNYKINIITDLRDFDFSKIDDISELETIYEIVKKYNGE